MAVYCISDLHGRYDVWKKMKEIFTDDDTIFCLGDCGDRGPDGWKLITEMLSTDNVIYLKGNHEDMLINAADEYLERDCICGDEWYLLALNGGNQTFEDWAMDPYRERWLHQLKWLPQYKQYVNKDGITFLMSHAGYAPTKFDINPNNADDLLWDRSHFFERWDKNLKNYIILHGHTNFYHIKQCLGDLDQNSKSELYDKNIGAYWYCNEHKCSLDRATANTGIAVILNLDTLEETIISIND